MLTLIWTIFLLVIMIGSGYMMVILEPDDETFDPRFVVSIVSLGCGVALAGMHEDQVVRPYFDWLGQVLPEKGSGVHVVTKWLLALLSACAAYLVTVFTGVYLGERRIKSRERSMR